MNLILSIACVILVVQSAVGLNWSEFRAENNVAYRNKLEESMRKAIFEANKERVELFNKESAEEAGFELGLNHLSDRTSDEIALRLGFRLPQNTFPKNSPDAEKFLETLLAGVEDDDLPTSVDWTKVDGRVTSVKDQGHCGSCWAFATTGALEGQMKVRNVTMIPLSEQDLIDCSIYNHGCDGGVPISAWLDIKDKGGIESEADYPYQAKVGKCKFEKSKAVFMDKYGVVLPQGREHLLKKVVATIGPVAGGIDASLPSFAHYKDGVYHDKDCGSGMSQLNHAILIVGYGTDEKTQKDYWLVKNSWGAKWGAEGYIKMARNADNSCGIATAAMFPTFKD